jgi:hypothetical protein
MEQRPFGFTKRVVAVIGQGPGIRMTVTPPAALRQGLDPA